MWLLVIKVSLLFPKKGKSTRCRYFVTFCMGSKIFDQKNITHLDREKILLKVKENLIMYITILGREEKFTFFLALLLLGINIVSVHGEPVFYMSQNNISLFISIYFVFIPGVEPDFVQKTFLIF